MTDTPKDDNVSSIKPTGRDPSTGKFLAGNKASKGRVPGYRPSPRLPEWRELMESKAPEVIQRLIDLALDGDIQAIRIFMDRVMPVQSLIVEDLQAQLEELRQRLDEAQQQGLTH